MTLRVKRSGRDSARGIAKQQMRRGFSSILRLHAEMESLDTSRMLRKVGPLRHGSAASYERLIQKYLDRGLNDIAFKYVELLDDANVMLSAEIHSNLYKALKTTSSRTVLNSLSNTVRYSRRKNQYLIHRKQEHEHYTRFKQHFLLNKYYKDCVYLSLCKKALKFKDTPFIISVLSLPHLNDRNYKVALSCLQALMPLSEMRCIIDASPLPFHLTQLLLDTIDTDEIEHFKEVFVSHISRSPTLRKELQHGVEEPSQDWGHDKWTQKLSRMQIVHPGTEKIVEALYRFAESTSFTGVATAALERTATGMLIDRARFYSLHSNTPMVFSKEFSKSSSFRSLCNMAIDRFLSSYDTYQIVRNFDRPERDVDRIIQAIGGFLFALPNATNFNTIKKLLLLMIDDGVLLVDDADAYRAAFTFLDSQSRRVNLFSQQERLKPYLGPLLKTGLLKRLFGAKRIGVYDTSYIAHSTDFSWTDRSDAIHLIPFSVQAELANLRAKGVALPEDILANRKDRIVYLSPVEEVVVLHPKLWVRPIDNVDDCIFQHVMWLRTVLDHVDIGFFSLDKGLIALAQRYHTRVNPSD